MSANSTQNGSDFPIDDIQLAEEADVILDPYIVSVMAEKHDHDAPEDIGFQDYLKIISE